MLLTVLAACTQQSAIHTRVQVDRYPTTPVDWSPDDGDLCGLQPEADLILLGPWPDATPAYDAVTADLDDDGHDDLVYTLRREEDWHTGGFRVHRGGPQGLEPAIWFEAWGADGITLGDPLSAGDLDGDGFDDLVVTATWDHGDTNGSEVQLWLGGAEPPTAPARVWPGGGETVVTDADGDGQVDLLVGDGDRSVAVYLGGPGGPAAVADHVVEAASTYLGPAGDVDGDGRGDAFGLRGERAFWIPGGGLAGAPVEVPAPPGRHRELPVAADVDGDGRDDVVAIGGDGELAWWSGVATGAPDGILQKLFAAVAAAPAGDLDGDGHEELYVGLWALSVDGAEVSGAIDLHRGSTDGPAPLEAARISSLPGGGCSMGDSFTTGDLDGDGDLDLIVALRADTRNGPQADAVAIFLTDPGVLP